MLRKMANIVARPLLITFENLWRSRDVPDDWKGQISYPAIRTAQKRTQETSGSLALLQSLGH